MLRVHPDVIKRLRAFAEEPGALFIPVQASTGSVTIWADDIIAAKTDEDLIQVITTAVERSRMPKAGAQQPAAVDANRPKGVEAPKQPDSQASDVADDGNTGKV